MRVGEIQRLCPYLILGRRYSQKSKPQIRIAFLITLSVRRGRALADKEIAEGKLEQAQKKFKDIPTAEAYLEDCKIRFETISEMAKTGNKLTGKFNI